MLFLSYRPLKGEIMTCKKLFSTIFLLIISYISFPTSSFADTVTGTVYDDANRNGILDKKEKGIADVEVSNGYNVVLTDSKGRYRIDINVNDILFITKPSGYAVPQDDNNIPQFFYIHSPEGTPGDASLKYPGLQSTGSIKGDINFPMYRYKEPEDYNVILVSDPQTKTKEELSYFRNRIVSELADYNAAFGITTGDILFDDLSLFPVYRGIMAQAGIPWFNLPGNHDINFTSPDDARSLDTYKRYLGPAYYSFNWGKAHYIILDTIFYNGTDPSKKNSSGGYAPKLDERQMKWLRADLAHVPGNRLIVMAMHVPLDSIGESSHGGPVENRVEILKLLSGFETVLLIGGHLHATQHVYFDAEDGYNGKKPLHLQILTAASGTWWSGAKDETGIPNAIQLDGTPNGYHVMSVKGNKCNIRYRAAGKPDDYQMRISIEKIPEKEVYSTVPASMINSLTITVNLFDGGEKSTVTCKVDDNDPFLLAKETKTDAFAFKSYEKANMPISGIETPSSHIWTGAFKDTLTPGTHKIFIKAVDEYGKEHHDIALFEVADDKIEGKAMN
jgi:hypothetical protein